MCHDCCQKFSGIDSVHATMRRRLSSSLTVSMATGTRRFDRGLPHLDACIREELWQRVGHFRRSDGYGTMTGTVVRGFKIARRPKNRGAARCNPIDSITAPTET